MKTLIITITIKHRQFLKAFLTTFEVDVVSPLGGVHNVDVFGSELLSNVKFGADLTMYNEVTNHFLFGGDT